jgi:hypothetical protein
MISNRRTVSGRNPAHGYSAWPSGLPCTAGRNSREAAAWRLDPAGKMACVAHGNARAPAWSPRAGRRGGVLTGGLAVASRSQGVAGDLEGATGEVPGKEEGARVHRSSGPTVRRRKRRWAAVFNGGGVAPVAVDECGGIRQLEGDQGVRRRQSIEEWSSSVGAHRKGTDGGDTQTESGVEEGLRWWEASEVDAWAVGDERAALGRG